MYIYKNPHIYTHASVRAHTQIFNKQVGQGIQTQRCRLSPLFASNFFRLHHPDLPCVIGRLIQEEITQNLTLLTYHHVIVVSFLVLPEILGGSQRSKPF